MYIYICTNVHIRTNMHTPQNLDTHMQTYTFLSLLLCQRYLCGGNYSATKGLQSKEAKRREIRSQVDWALCHHPLFRQRTVFLEGL